MARSTTETDRDDDPPSAPDHAQLTPHSDQCLGCGPGNPAGIAMRVFREDDAVYSDVVFAARHVGAPGLAHGGAVATACDDLFGFLLYVVGEPAVTGSLQVDYHSPAVLGTSYRIRARLERRDGRRLHMLATGSDSDGRVCFESRAVFIVVPLAHFQRYGSPDSISHVFANTAPAPAPACNESDPVKGPAPS